MHFSIDRTVHTTAFDKPVVDHWLERKIHISVADPENIIIIYLFIYLFIIIELNDLKALLFSIRATVKKN